MASLTLSPLLHSSRSLQLTARTPWSADWFIVMGIEYCQLTTSPSGQNCIHDGQGAYGGNERCVVQAVRGLYASATMYDIDSGRDYVSINGAAYSLRHQGPFNVWMNAGETMQWQSDSTVARQGFMICASQNMLSSSPPPQRRWRCPLILP